LLYIYCAVEDAVMTLTVNVDEDTAPALNNGHDLLEDILVLHLEKGKDFFITVSGNYLPSCFGSSLETLVHLHTYIREVPVAQLVDLVCTASSTNNDGKRIIVVYCRV
jgi:phosphatidylinositol-bisphosphatase